MKPKILIVVDSMNGGGVQQVLRRIGRGLSEAGFGISFATLRPSGSLYEAVAREFEVHNIDEHPFRPSALIAILRVFGAYREMFGLKRFNYSLRSVMRHVPPLVAVLKTVRPDVVISATPSCNIFSILAKEVARSGARTIVSEHNNLSIVLSKKWAGDRERARVVDILRTAYLRADAIVAVSHGLQRDVAETLGLPPDGIRVAYNPALDREFEEKRLDPCEEEWLNNKSCPVFVAVGRISGQKNYPVLLEAVRVANKTRSLRLLVIGGGDKKKHRRLLAELRGQCKVARLEDRVKFLGERNNPGKFLTLADGFVLSSDYEGFGLVLVEALACGVPVVSTDCPSGPREILGDGAYGRLVPCGDAAALARALLESLETPPDSERLRARAADFSTEKSVLAYRRIVDTLLDGTARGQSNLAYRRVYEATFSTHG